MISNAAAPACTAMQCLLLAMVPVLSLIKQLILTGGISRQQGSQSPSPLSPQLPANQSHSHTSHPLSPLWAVPFMANLDVWPHDQASLWVK